MVIMNIRQPDTDLISITEPEDNLKLITGIGPAIENRLHAAGIISYADLAQMDPEGLADLFSDFPGLTAAQIDKKDWIGQAKRLDVDKSAPKTSHLLPEQEPQTQEMRQHYAVFTIELLLDENNRARRTRAMHVQSQMEQSWAGWDTPRLIAFITSNAALSSSEGRPTAPPLEAVTPPPVQTQTVSLLSGAMIVKETEILGPSVQGAKRMISAGQPFALRLGIDLRKIAESTDNLLNYSAILYVRKLGIHQRQVAGASSGSFHKADYVDIQIGGGPLGHGSYRMEIIVFIAPDGQEPGPGAGMAAMSEGEMLWVN
jgi:hypothetical protein